MSLKLQSAMALLAACALETAALSQPADRLAPAPANPSPAASPTEQQAAAAEGQPAATTHCCKLPALTAVELEILTPASSKTSKQGDQIHMRVIAPVSVDGKVLIPAGTEAFAEVIQASRGAFGGKAGELVVGAPYLMLNGQRIGLKRLHYGPSSGRDRTGEAMIISAVAGGLFGMLDGGGNIDVQSGARANAVVTTDTFVSIQPDQSSTSTGSK